MGLGRRPRKGEVGSVGDVAPAPREDGADEDSGTGGIVTIGAFAAVGVVAVKTGEGAV
jgi:hypothetical protein